MSCFTIKTSVALLAGALCSPPTIASKNAPQASPTSSQGELRLKAPDGWVSERPSSSMRVSQYQLPAAEGDTEGASLVVYYFGAGQGGSVDANLERWIGQMQPADRRPSRDTSSVNGMKVTLLDVTGTYAGGDMGGGGGAIAVATPVNAPMRFSALHRLLCRWSSAAAMSVLMLSIR